LKQSLERFLTPLEKSVRKRLESWRAHRVGKAIPEKLWKDVASLIPGTTVNRISKMMGLNHTVLKRHYSEWKAQTTAFVELTTADSVTSISTEQKPLDTTIEIILENGCQVTISQQFSCESAGNLFTTVWKELQCSR